jgi:(1->4)-alpha-D-glucan 1-alpha-D-glucosylmutase
MLAGSTHDTKRSEDVRARINVLSELPAEWEAALGRWGELNARHRREVDGAPAPDRNDEYLLYQTILGAWPDELQIADCRLQIDDTPDLQSAICNLQSFRERIATYMQKATKEAKIHTSWINPNEAYDEAVQGFVDALLDDAPENPFVRDVLPLARRVAFFGRFNSLAQTLLRLTAPGVPDIYRGTELWDLSLVDPDNRRPVDFARRERMLAELRQRIGRGEQRAAMAADLLEHSADGCIKLYLIAEALALRARREQLFAAGDYLPLDASGAQQEHVCAFARTLGEESVLAVAPRLVVGLTGGEERTPKGEVWADTRLMLPHEEPGRSYRDALTGAALAVEDGEGGPGLALSRVFAHLPVALLERDSS